MDEFIRIRGAREHNLKSDRRRPAAQRARGDHRAVRLRQVLARVRHHLRRRPAPLRREPLGVRPPVPRADAEAGRRFDHRSVAGDRDRAEDHVEEPALHGRHGHRDLRLPAPALRPDRHPVFARDRAADREPDRLADGRPGHGPERGRAPLPAGADRARAQGRVPQGVRRAAARRLPAGQGRRPAVRAGRGAEARQEAEARHRAGGRPRGAGARARAAPRRFDRDRAQSFRRPASGRERGYRRAAAAVGEVRLPGVRLHHRGDRAAPVLVQQPAGRLSGVRRPRPPHVHGPRSRGARPGEEPVRRRGRALGQLDLDLLPADPGQHRQALPPEPAHAVGGAAEQDARADPVRLGRGAGRAQLRRRRAPLQHQPVVRGRAAEPAAALARDRFRMAQGGARQVSEHARRARPAPAIA